MRATRAVTALAVLTVVLAGCTAQDGPEGTPAATTPETDTPGPEPTTEAPDPEPTEDAAATPTDLPADVLPTTSGLAVEAEPREEDDEVTAWRLGCSEQVPADATAMRTVSWGTGELEAPVAVHQVAVFADAEQATAAADDLAAAMQECADAPAEANTTYLLEPVDVGAQGYGLATDYYGTAEGGDLDGVIGTYLVAFRRGNAVALVASEGGEGNVAEVRESVVAESMAAWEGLCRYDSAGC
ncbi:hypothetical protein J4G33_06735 [Actinotalea sp. BY-33]|uniref:Sensor domain-containing protein n=1 Tax=Actinotalea soli TaxID=2819234 RepID=A0A939LPH2_9CELL|nr:hypothetical protein [Actinotalea soli]MBO1751498.1 hypothetical protein [Actinotalea soli]